MKILLFTYDFPPFRGGISTYTLTLATGLKSQGWNVHVLCPGDSSLPDPPGIRVHRFRAGSSALSKFLSGKKALSEILRRTKPDLIHAVSSMAHLASGWPAQPAIPLIMTVHGTEVNRNLLLRKGFARLGSGWFRAAYENASRIVCVSDYTLGLARRAGLPAARLAVVQNGVDTRMRQHPPEEISHLCTRLDLFGRKVILTVAQLHPRKGQETVIDALPSILSKVPEAAYLMVGRGDHELELRHRARERGVERAVRFLTDGEDHPHLYGVAHCFALISRPVGASVEGFGLSAAEAMAAGVPVVVSDSGGLAEVVEHGKSGWVVPPGNAIRVAESIVEILTRPSESAHLAQAARLRVESLFSMEKWVEEMTNIYRQAVAEGRPRPTSSSPNRA